VTGVFQEWQPVYAEHGVATFPVNDNKVPAVRNYGRIGINASSSLASRFGSAALGFMCGRRSGITVLDVDTTDERVLADAVDRHGKTPIVARSGSGHFQAWYRYAGERRLIRPRRDVPIDILGGGYVVAPPSRVAKGSYEFIAGSLDDLESLPTLNDAPPAFPADVPADWGQMRDGNGRNNALFRLLGRSVRNCDDFEQLLDYAQTRNAELGEPMPEMEVLKVAKSVWKMQYVPITFQSSLQTVVRVLSFTGGFSLTKFAKGSRIFRINFVQGYCERAASIFGGGLPVEVNFQNEARAARSDQTTTNKHQQSCDSCLN